MTDQLQLVGREKETSWISSIIRKGRGYVLLLSGETGTGKSSLVLEAVRRNNVRLFSSRAFVNAPPYSLFSSILRSFIREQNESRIDFGMLTGYLAPILPEIKNGKNEEDKEALLQALCDALTIISKGKQTVLFFDDLHYADDATLDLLPYLSERLGNSKISLLAAFRDDEISAEKLRHMRNELRRRKKVLEFSLFPFDEEKTGVFAQFLLNAEVPPPLNKIIFQRTAGIPLFIEEFCYALILKNFIEFKDGSAFLTSDCDMPLPESLIDIVSVKLENISAEARSMLEIAASAGQEFDIDIFKTVSGNEEALDELFKYNFIKETEPGKAGFKSSLVQQTIRNLTGWTKRKELNKKVAEYFISRRYHPEIIAAHYLESNDFASARKYFLESARSSCSIRAYSDAARSISRALELWPKEEEESERFETLLQLANCAQLSGQFEQAVKVLQEIISGCEEKKQEFSAKAYRKLAIVYGLQSKWNLAAKALYNSAKLFEKENMPEDACMEYLSAAARYTSLLDLTEALYCSSKAVELSERIKNYNVKSRALGLKGNVTAMLGNPEEGSSVVQEGLNLALEKNLTEAASEIYRRLANTMEYRSDYISATNVYTQAYNYCINSGSEVYAQICLSCMASIFFQTGEWKKALEVCSEVLKNKKSPEGSKNPALSTSALIYAFRGQGKTAEKYLGESYNLTQKLQQNIIFFGLSWGRAILAETAGDNEKMYGCYSEALELLKNIPERHESIPVLMWAAKAFSKAGKDKNLISCIENLSLISAESSNPEALSALAFALGEFALFSNKPEEAAAKFEQAMLHQHKISVPLQKMFLECRLGEVLALMNDRQGAAGYLFSALSISRNLGARPYSQQISQTLSLLGFKPDERVKSGKYDPATPLYLTQRQNEILKYLIKGLTNKEIAEQIFLSTRTIDMHVAHILERLNCRTRTEAIARARELEII